MKRLFLVRHAKSSWEYNVSDYERPLNARGFKDAQLVSNELIGHLNPEIVLSSDAMRAKTTANIFMTNLKVNEKIFKLNHSLYDFSGKNVLEVIKNVENSISELLIFGHNNAITSIVNSYGNLHINNVPTCGVVGIEFESDTWKDIERGITIKTLFPRDLKG